MAAVLLVLAVGLSGCGWRGVNSLPLPGTEGGGPGAFQVQAQLPQVTNLERNSRVRVGDVTVGNVSNIERQGWHALVTMTLNGNVELPANATVKIGQTSLLGTLHIELAPPVDEEPKGKLQNGSLIPLENDASYPTTEQTLAAVSMLFNGGGLGQVHDITRAFSTAFKGREQDMRSFLEQLNLFVGELDGQKHDIIAATDSLNAVSGQFAAQTTRRRQGAADDSGRVGGDQRRARGSDGGVRRVRRVQRVGGRCGEPEQGQCRQGTRRRRPGTQIARRRRTLDDAVAELPVDVSVPEGDHRELGPRRLCEPDRQSST